MRLRKLIYPVMALCLAIAASVSGLAQGKNVKEGQEQAEKAATVFKEILSVPDKAIPKKVLDGAECIAVFPQVIKGGFIIGGRGGRGVASCRMAGGWSAPAYFEMKGGSFGLQIGAEAVDFVLVFMNEKAMDSLLKSKFTLGADASVAAGPVGREAGAETDALMTAQVLSYSRSKGVFGGLELKGTAISQEKKEIEDVYGSGVTVEQVLKKPKDQAPKEVQVYPDTLTNFTAAKAASK
ncbi:MAG: lipid-binding SYLF domain-containing protein [Acidobacteria bacterium]|nr:lipid-binding SYLF domain-containing protein [Acidobacteriota bacterium]